MQNLSGVSLGPAKKSLVSGRLARRLMHYGLSDYGAYLDRVEQGNPPEELATFLDLLTTHETHFFREMAHFRFLLEQVLPHWRGRAIRAWSAACSSGEEAYSLAMTLADGLGEGPWSILASDISHRMLELTRDGVYSQSGAYHIPKAYLERYCLKGVRSQQGNILVDPSLQARLTLRAINLAAPLPDFPPVDLILLRNVMIYFDLPTKQGVVRRLVNRLQPGGYLLVGHAESLYGLDQSLILCRPAVYRKNLE